MLFYLVTVTGTATDMVRGVLCQVRLASDADMMTGTFTLVDGEDKLKLMQCTDADNSVTHMRANDVMSVSFYWNPPMGDMGDVKVM